MDLHLLFSKKRKRNLAFEKKSEAHIFKHFFFEIPKETELPEKSSDGNQQNLINRENNQQTD